MGKNIVRGEEARKQAVELVKSGKTIYEAAEVTGFVSNYVRQLCKAAGVTYDFTGDGHVRESILKLHGEGKEVAAIVEETHCSDSYARCVLKEAGLKCNKPKKKHWHKISAETRRLMRAYKAEGHSHGEVAERFNVSEVASQQICKGISPQSRRRPKQYVNQFTKDPERNIERIKSILAERCPGFEYVGNYTGTDGYMDLRCKECGTIFTRSCISVRHGTVSCDACSENARTFKKIESQKEKERKRQLAERDRRISRKCEQMSMKFCQVCGSPFIGAGKYCSERCRNQNKWQMKDGYRYQFPLEEVFNRANGICYICGKPCDWNDYTERDGVIIYGDNYPSRDHVIPKSRGGANSWENIKLAHRICNSLKSAALPLGQKMA